MQREKVALFIAEGCAFIEHWLVDEVEAGKADFERSCCACRKIRLCEASALAQFVERHLRQLLPRTLFIARAPIRRHFRL